MMPQGMVLPSLRQRLGRNIKASTASGWVGQTLVDTAKQRRERATTIVHQKTSLPKYVTYVSTLIVSPLVSMVVRGKFILLIVA
jgi:hypothetical protein